jgi:hypothetical protein
MIRSNVRVADALRFISSFKEGNDNEKETNKFNKKEDVFIYHHLFSFHPAALARSKYGQERPDRLLYPDR